MQVDFVLGKWFPEEIRIVKNKMDASVETIENFALEGIERTMNFINKQEFI